MKFRAEIDVMPLDALLDPQGKAVTGSMKNIGLDSIENVRIGRHIRLNVVASKGITSISALNFMFFFFENTVFYYR